MANRRQSNKNPSAYYVKIHNARYPGGAVRGQLRKRQLRDLSRRDSPSTATDRKEARVVGPCLRDRDACGQTPTSAIVCATVC